MVNWKYYNLDPENPEQGIREQQLKEFYRNLTEKELQHKIRMSHETTIKSSKPIC